MMLVALKRLRYPRGAEGVEYSPGDSFQALSERDFKALTLTRLAAEQTKRTPKKTLSLKAAEPTETETARANGYGRRDMRAED